MGRAALLGRRLGRALVAAGEDRQARHPSGRYRAQLRSAQPLAAYIPELDLDLDGDDITIDATVAAATVEDPLRTGDTLILVELADDDFVAVGLERG